jgi:hypothetical protein
MKKIGSLVILALGLAACGSQEKKVDSADRVAFNDEVKAALATESASLPYAMIVRVPMDASGQEDASKAELRAAKAVNSNLDATWNAAESHASPSDSDKFVVVNPQEADAQAVAALANRYGYGFDQNTRRNDTVNTSATQGNNGLVVTGSNNYTYFNQINTNSNLNAGSQVQDIDASRFGYNVRPGVWGNNCRGIAGCSNLNWGGYYRHAYRPVFRSPNFGYGGFAGYWGFFSQPYRRVVGNDCFYIYGRPAHYGASVTASSLGWGY